MSILVPKTNQAADERGPSGEMVLRNTPLAI